MSFYVIAGAAVSGDRLRVGTARRHSLEAARSEDLWSCPLLDAFAERPTDCPSIQRGHVGWNKRR